MNLRITNILRNFGGERSDMINGGERKNMKTQEDERNNMENRNRN